MPKQVLTFAGKLCADDNTIGRTGARERHDVVYMTARLYSPSIAIRGGYWKVGCILYTSHITPTCTHTLGYCY